MACVSCDGQQGADESCTQVLAADIPEWVNEVSCFVTYPLPVLLLLWSTYIHRQKNVQDGNRWGANLGERLQESPSSQRTDYRSLCEVVTLDTDTSLWLYSIPHAWISGLILPCSAAALCFQTQAGKADRRRGWWRGQQTQCSTTQWCMTAFGQRTWKRPVWKLRCGIMTGCTTITLVV